MKLLKEFVFEGVVECSYDEFTIGGRDVMGELDEYTYKKVSADIKIDDLELHGLVYMERGLTSYSEWTPGKQGVFALSSERGITLDLYDTFEDLDGTSVKFYIGIIDKS